MHARTPAKICLQLGHSGRKGSTQLGWEKMDHPLPSGNWPLLAPSPLPYLPGLSQTPIEMTRADMDEVREEFVRAARRGLQAGFDMLELHMAPRLSAGVLPVAADQPPRPTPSAATFEAACASRSRCWTPCAPSGRTTSPCRCAFRQPIGPTGASPRRTCSPSRAHSRSAGVDLIDVSTGQTVPWQKPVYGRMWQTPFADQVRNEIGIATMAVGNIYEPDHVNSIIASGRADLCAIARPHLSNPALDARGRGEARISRRNGGRSSISRGRASSSVICSVPRKPAEVSHD